MRELYEKYKGIAWGIFLVAVTIFSVLFCLIKKATLKVYTVDSRKISEVHVDLLMELAPEYYGETKKFVVREQNNMELMTKALEEKHVDKNEDAIREAVSFSVDFLYKNGEDDLFVLSYAGVPADSFMGQVFCSMEVVKQIRTVFTVDKENVARVELFHWKTDNTQDAITEEIKDKKAIDEVWEVARQDVLANPATSMENTKCGIRFRDKAGKVLLIVNISKDMEGYERLLRKIPMIGKYCN